MSEYKPEVKVLDGEKENGEVLRIRCDEGPPQVTVECLRMGNPSIMAPGAPPPINVEHCTMRPVLRPERPPCGRHRYDDKADDGWDDRDKRNCGNCRFGTEMMIKTRNDKEE